MEPARRGSFFRNAASILLTSGVSIPFALATSILLARFLTVEDRGIYYLLTAFIGVSHLLSQLGWPTASIYRIRRVGISPAVVVSAGLVTNVIAGLTAVTICLLLESPLRSGILSGAPLRAFLVAVAVIPFLVVGGFLRGVAQAIDRFDLFNWYAFLHAAGILVCVLVVVVWLGGGLEAAIAAYCGVNVILAIWLLGAVLRSAGGTASFGLSEITQSMGFGVKSYLQNLTHYLHEHLGAFVIAAILDARQVAFWGIALGAISRLNLVPTSISTALFPRLAGSSAEEAGAFTGYVARHSLLWLFLLIAVLLPTAPLLIPLLYGSAYVESVTPFLWLLLVMIPLTLSRIVSRYFMAVDRQQVVIAIRVLGIGVNVALYFWWVPTRGVVGAAQANLVSYSLEAASLIALFLRASDQSLGQIITPSAADLDPYRRRLRAALGRLRGLRSR